MARSTPTRSIPNPRLAAAKALRALGPGATDAHFMLIALFAALVVVLLTMLGAHKASPLGLEHHLETRAQKALSEAGIWSVHVRMDGQTAHVDGASPAPGVEDKAKALVLASTGKGGWWNGGVTRVIASVAVASEARPFTWRATRADDGVTITGHAPSLYAKTELARRARALFRGGVDDRSAIAAGAPSGDWLKLAEQALIALADLPGGEARLVDRRLILMGEAPRPAVEKVRQSFAKAPFAPFETVLDVSVAGEGAPELAGIRLAGANKDTCQEAFSQIMARNVINFDTGSAVISAASVGVLNNLAAVARRCDRYSIMIAGHTDNQGDRVANMALSRLRAQAVVNYLAARGVTADRLSAQGYGPDRPVASNASVEGQAHNRRIEFSVQS